MNRIAVIIVAAILIGMAGIAILPSAQGAGATYQYNFIAVNKVKLGNVTLSKVDDLGNPISGAVFTLTCTPLAYTVTQTTPASGLLTWTALKWGDYTLREVSVPEGYDPDPLFPMVFHIGK